MADCVYVAPPDLPAQEQLTKLFDQACKIIDAPKELGINEKTTNLDVYKVLDLMFKERGLVYHKLSTYDIFIEDVKDIIRTTVIPPIEDRKSQGMYQYTFGNVAVIPPPWLPQEARLGNKNYNVTVTVDIIRGFTSVNGSSTQEVFRNQKICELPLMLRSKYCHTFGKTKEELIELGECDNDIGGYYIVTGKERCLVIQERIEYNRIYVWAPQKAKDKKTYKLMTEVRNQITRGTKPAAVKIFIEGTKECVKNIVCLLPGLKEEIQVGTILYALGIVCGNWTIDDDVSTTIRKLINPDGEDDEQMNQLVDIILHNSRLGRQKNCFEIIGQMANASIAHKQRTEFIIQLLKKEIFTKIKQDKYKVFYMCHMIRRLAIVFFERRTEDDRDHFANKRCDTDGKLLEDLFRGFFELYVTNITEKLVSHPNNVSIFERDYTVTQGIQFCMRKGNWGIQKIGYQKVGVCQLLTQTTYMTALSHLRRASSNRSTESRAMKLRQLHGSQWGIFDPAETPEGKMSGILKNLAIAAHITSQTSEEPVYTVLRMGEEFIEDITIENFNSPKVFLNGSLVGLCNVPGMLLERLREARTIGALNHDTSISYKVFDKELHIYTDAGRCSRPLLVVKKEKLLLSSASINGNTWSDLLRQGYIQYVDTTEEQTSYIAMYPTQITKKTNYCEIHPVTILGVLCCIIPFPDHNQSPRNAYSSAMTKQAMGVFAGNFLQRFDTSSYVLHYPQKPLVSTFVSDYISYNELPSGHNAIVAILSYTGFGQEDSVILNEGALKRGLFQITVYKTYTAEEQNQENQTIESIEAPIDTKGIDRSKNYLKLDEEGIIRERTISYKDGKKIYGNKTIVKEGDVIIRKTIRRDGKNSERVDVSVVHKLEETGFVDKVIITKNADGNKLVKVRVGFNRIPILGDKFASVHAQKGTTGMILKHEDMPFTGNGIVPDIIINPNCMPSRMTIGHLIECVTGKAAIFENKCADGTPFPESETFMVNHLAKVGKKLHENGFQRRGEEAMYSGMTGEMMPATIYIGPTYYRRLKHMVIDKLSARSEGPVQNYTRQPANQGRKNGTKFTSIKNGTMETDAELAHGASQTVRDRLMICKDYYVTDVCNKCGMIAPQGCSKCDAGVTATEMPYAFKLLIQNMIALGLRPQIETDMSTMQEESLQGSLND